MFLIELFLAQIGVCRVVGLGEVGNYLFESLATSFLVVVAGFGYGVALVVCLAAQSLAQFLVVHLMAVFAFHVGAELFGQFNLHLAHRFDGIHSCFECTDHVLFAHFLHLAFHHHDVFGRGTDHDVHVCFFHLLECRVDDILAIDTCYAHL